MTAWLLDTTVAVSLLILLVLLIRRPFAEAFGARAAYALWLAPAVRAVMPPLPQAPLADYAPSLAGNIDLVLVSTPAQSSSLPSLAVVAGAIWLAGTLSFLAVHLWRHYRFVREALQAGRVMAVDGVAYDVVASGRVDGPVATGLIHPLILVPSDFEQRFSPEQQRFALWHEQLHHRRGDIWASAAALLLTSLLWFNPFAHLALGAFRRDMEAACDARLLAEAGHNAAPAYAETILRCAARPVPRSLCALTSIDELKGRLLMLKTNHGAARRISGLLIAATVTVGGLAFAAPAVAVQEKDKKEVVKFIEVHETQGDAKDVVRRHGDREGLVRIAATCDGEKFEVGSEGGTEAKKENIRFILCAHAGESLLPALEKAAARIEKDDDMSAARKTEILSKLREKISELRAKS